MASPFVDAHVHFWDPARLPYPWLAAVPSIAGPRRPADLRAETQELAARMVFVQAECDATRSFEEVEWAEELAREEPRLAAFVAFAPMDRGEQTARALEQLGRRPIVRGVRHVLQDEADPGALSSPALARGVRLAGERGLSFDLCLRHGQLAAAAQLVRACPGTRFVLDHAGKPDVRGGRLDPWRADVERLAAFPHVACKLSGLVTEADPARWRVEQLAPFVDHLLACFGAERLLFGSDWPVVTLASGYARWLGAARALVERLPESARRAIFVDNARAVYRLP